MCCWLLLVLCCAQPHVIKYTEIVQNHFHTIIFHLFLSIYKAKQNNSINFKCVINKKWLKFSQVYQVIGKEISQPTGCECESARFCVPFSDLIGISTRFNVDFSTYAWLFCVDKFLFFRKLTKKNIERTHFCGNVCFLLWIFDNFQCFFDFFLNNFISYGLKTSGSEHQTRKTIRQCWSRRRNAECFIRKLKCLRKTLLE